ncbi:hypothetical protein [Leptolyngbya sp. KIOST-1]|uniref:hypothetical protein n=1 Tax=Leptolyngbya sp. KIOST-1 TaxID=1229172 RepID=UPI00055C2A94|nr:hypothetical protein [Leptolyngbya sp. KIOST-1]
MTTTNDRLDRIEATLEKLAEDLTQMRSEQAEMRSEQAEIRRAQAQMSNDQDRGRKWEDRTWDVVKWVGGISAGLSISAAVALVGLIVRLGLNNQ